MVALQKILVDVGFAKSTDRYWPSKKVLVDNNFTGATEVFTRR